MKGKHRLLLPLLFFGVLMGALDISIVGPAIPSIDQSLKIEPRLLGWIFSVYVLANLVSLSLFAKLSDIFGRRIIYIISISIFAIGSMIVSVSDNFELLIIGRIIQGFGAGGFLPVASAVIGDVYPPEERGRKLGLIGAVFGIAFIIGPIIAGFLLKYYDWNILFMINVPIAVLIIIASVKIIPGKTEVVNRYFDWKGIILLGSGLAIFALGINNIEDSNFFENILSNRVLPYIAISILLAVLLFFAERKSPSPVIKFGFLRNRQIRIAGFIAFVTGMAQSAFVFIPTFAGDVFKVSASTAGFMLIPLVVATAIGSPIFGKMIDQFGSKKIIILGIVLMAMGYLGMGLVGHSKLSFYTTGAILGFGFSVLSGSALRYIMLNETDSNDRAVSQGILNIFISLGQIIGAAVIGVIVADSLGGIAYKPVFIYLAIILAMTLMAGFRLKNSKEEIEILKEIRSDKEEKQI
jgi:EmrB/QacA subfamily drug resistance transporter